MYNTNNLYERIDNINKKLCDQSFILDRKNVSKMLRDIKKIAYDACFEINDELYNLFYRIYSFVLNWFCDLTMFGKIYKYELVYSLIDEYNKRKNELL